MYFFRIFIGENKLTYLHMKNVVAIITRNETKYLYEGQGKFYWIFIPQGTIPSNFQEIACIYGCIYRPIVYIWAKWQPKRNG